MYAKTLVPGPPLDTPSLMATTDDPDVLLPQLRALGWGRFGGPVPAGPAGQLVISPDRLQLVVNGQAVLDDLNPVSPLGWWKAVDQLGGKCVVVVGGALLFFSGVTASLWVLWVRHTPTAGERNLSLTIAAERRAGRHLAAALSGSPWVLFHDRRLPHSEHRVPFLAAGPGGIALIAVLPAGPYLILAPTGVKAGEDELTSGWLPARVWESRYLMQQLAGLGTRDLRFTGPVIPMAVEGYPRTTKIPAGWSAQPPTGSTSTRSAARPH